MRRVLVLGDSFTEGQGVKEPDTYPRVLEARLNSPNGPRWEVRNCGRRGADFPLLFELFEQILSYEPDVIVYGMVLNDADQSEEFHSRQTYVNDLILDRGRTMEGRPLPEGRLALQRVLRVLSAAPRHGDVFGEEVGRVVSEVVGDAGRLIPPVRSSWRPRSRVPRREPRTSRPRSPATGPSASPRDAWRASASGRRSSRSCGH